MNAQLAHSFDRIGQLELFRSLPDGAIESVRAAMHIEHAPKDAVICGQGQRVDRACALAAGSLRIVQTGSDGGQTIVRFIRPGEMFGTLPLFTDHRCPADAIAAEASTVLTWSERSLLELMTRHPPIAHNVIQVLGTRMAQLQERLRELTTQRVEQRIAHAVLRLARQYGNEVRGRITIDVPLRRKDLADFAGTTLHTASRVVSAWEKAGLLVSSGQRLVIHNLAAINKLAESCAD